MVKCPHCKRSHDAHQAWLLSYKDRGAQQLRIFSNNGKMKAETSCPITEVKRKARLETQARIIERTRRTQCLQ